MDIERKCLQCDYSAEDQSPQMQLTIIGQKRQMCLHGPICGAAVVAGMAVLSLSPSTRKSTNRPFLALSFSRSARDSSIERGALNGYYDF
jgi:hypothetical protein